MELTQDEKAKDPERVSLGFKGWHLQDAQEEATPAPVDEAATEEEEVAWPSEDGSSGGENDGPPDAKSDTWEMVDNFFRRPAAKDPLTHELDERAEGVPTAGSVEKGTVELRKKYPPSSSGSGSCCSGKSEATAGSHGEAAEEEDAASYEKASNSKAAPLVTAPKEKARTKKRRRSWTPKRSRALVLTPSPSTSGSCASPMDIAKAIRSTWERTSGYAIPAAQLTRGKGWSATGSTSVAWANARGGSAPVGKGSTCTTARAKKHECPIGEERQAIFVCYKCVALREQITRIEALKLIADKRCARATTRSYTFFASMKTLQQVVVWAADLYGQDQKEKEMMLAILCGHCQVTIDQGGEKKQGFVSGNCGKLLR